MTVWQLKPTNKSVSLALFLACSCVLLILAASLHFAAPEKRFLGGGGEAWSPGPPSQVANASLYRCSCHNQASEDMENVHSQNMVGQNSRVLSTRGLEQMSQEDRMERDHALKVITGP